MPLSVRRGTQPKSSLDLDEGVPDHLFRHLWNWFRATSFFNHGTLDNLRGRDLLLHLKLDCESTGELWDECWEDRHLLLDVLDYALWYSRFDPSDIASARRQDLERILRVGRSAWRVAPSGDTLTERLSDEIHKALEHATASGTAAAEHLAEAWKHAWGRTPNAAASYDSGIKAIESALCSIVSPDHPKATLGSITRDIEQKPAKWQTRFDDDDSEGVKALSQLLHAVWRAHTRHGTNEYASDTLEQAKDVCNVALLVVNLVDSDGLARAEI